MAKTMTMTLAALMLIGLAGGAGARDLHVSVDGKDSNSGSAGSPFATMQGARKVVRSHIASGLKEPVTVIIHGGAYYLDAPLALTPEDSGTAECPITWRAAEGEKTVLSGGVRITGRWTPGEKGIWSVAIPGVKDGWNFRQLFVNGNRAIRARFPNADEANPFLYATGGGADHAKIDPKLIKAGWGSATDAQINVVAQWRFFNQWNLQTGSTRGFAVEVGKYPFKKGEPASITISNEGAGGTVVADSVAFVKVEANVAPVASHVGMTGDAQFGGTLTGSHTYSDAERNLKGKRR